MKVYARKGRLIRISLILCIIPLLYLLFNYSESHKKLNKIYNGRSAKLVKEEVNLSSDGTYFDLSCSVYHTLMLNSIFAYFYSFRIGKL